MKKIIRLTESDLHNIVKKSVNRILKEGVLGNDWRQNENDVLNNYEPFEDQIERYKAEDEFRNQHDWGAQGDEDIDPTYYDESDDVLGWNDVDDLSDGDLYRG